MANEKRMLKSFNCLTPTSIDFIVKSLQLNYIYTAYQSLLVNN